MKLTSGHPPADETRIASTHPGQAHWAGTGPPGRICGECIEHWGAMRVYHKAAPGSANWVLAAPRPRYCRVTGHLEPTSCDKRTRLLAPVKPIAVPPGAAACAYFRENPTPPPLLKPARKTRAKKHAEATRD